LDSPFSPTRSSRKEKSSAKAYIITPRRPGHDLPRARATGSPSPPDSATRPHQAEKPGHEPPDPGLRLGARVRGGLGSARHPRPHAPLPREGSPPPPPPPPLTAIPFSAARRPAPPHPRLHWAPLSFAPFRSVSHPPASLRLHAALI